MCEIVLFNNRYESVNVSCAAKTANDISKIAIPKSLIFVI